MTESDDRWYTPGDQWPRHRESWWRDTLKKARRNGWHYQVRTSHGGAKIYCTDPKDNPSACWSRVYSTAKNAEFWAKECALAIDRCPHTPKEDQVSIDAARKIIFAARRLLTLANTMIDREQVGAHAAEARLRAEELLQEAATAADDLETIEMAFDHVSLEASQHDRRERELNAEVSIVLHELDRLGENGLTPEGVLAEADSQSEDAQEAARQVQRERLRKLLQLEVAALRSDIARCRDRLW